MNLKHCALLASTLPTAETAPGWHYAAWVALDVRLLVMLALVSLLGACGCCVILVRRRDWLQLSACFIVSYVITLSCLVTVFNTLAQYPVFVVRSYFPFP